ncbi:MAG: pyridoxamine 5'-phosphate oxidase family protein [Jatrophihabitans sp.]|uniref:pyridoxamine 5'-phosphate oxidase family protein n=1 Tax=Jatrophihabitans sp. TaxID=1932789 RepID=UPI003F7D5A3E
MSTDRTALDALLDASVVGHVGLVAGGRPLVVPTAVARDGDTLLLHGSTGSGWMRALAAGADACVTVTALGGVVVARSAFESSLHYRSAVVFGRCRRLAGDEHLRALDRFTDKLIPGRVAEVRRPLAKELAATMALALPIAEWSLRISEGWPDDPPEDVAGDAWAGVVPLTTTYGDPRPAPDLRTGIPVPPSVVGLGRAPDQGR